MLFIWKLIEKLLMYVLISALVAFVSFSMMTGRFPPRKSDISQAIHLAKQMMSQTQEFNKTNQALEAHQAGGGTVSMQQMMQLQELGLKRTRTTLELLNILDKFPQGVPNQEIETKIKSISTHLDQAGLELTALQESLKAPPPVSN